MLQFIFGLPFSGKTYTVTNKIIELSKQGEETVLLVPEQASFESEKNILQIAGDKLSSKISVLTFSRLCDEIFRTVGGICAKTLSNSDKVIFMNKALCQVADELKLWGKYAHSVSFAKTILDTIGELKINAVSANSIKKASESTTVASLKDKLQNIALIYETYDLLTAEKFIDPADRLTKLYDKLADYNFFKNKTVFLDGFKGFTGQQFKIIDRIISQAKDVYITFTNDISCNNEFDIFSNVRATVFRLEKIAKAHNIQITKPLILTKSYYKNLILSDLERLISGNKISDFENNDIITICQAATVFDEAEFAIRTIRKLVREENYRYRDFVIIARDTEKYQDAIEYTSNKNNVPCFFDKQIPLSSFALSVATDAAIKALNFSTEDILRFLKSGISYLTTDELSKLENYTYLWNINGSLWLENWDMDVRGFVTDSPTEKEALELKEINSIREKAITPLLKFKDEFKNNAYNMSKAILTLLENCNAKSALDNLCLYNNVQDNNYTTNVLKQSFEAFLNVLDSLVTCFGQKPLSIKEFYEAYNLAISLESVGVIPQKLDQVTFGAADHIRPSKPKVAIILGANQGVFPKFSQNSGIFANNERKKLIELGIEIPDNTIYTSIDENYLVYSNLSCASEKLYVCYSLQTLKGEKTEPSYFVASIKEYLKPTIVFEPAKDLDINALPETAESVFSEFCKRFKDKSEAETLKLSLTSCEQINRVETVISSFENCKKSITTDNAKKLFGKDIAMSATKFDTLNRCKFSFFCKYGIKAKKLQPADFNVLQRGTIVHYVLERIIATYKETIKDLKREELDHLCDTYIDEYLDKVVGFRTVQNSKYEFLISKISRSLKEVVYHLSLEFAQSDFKPIACELAIGGKDGVPLNFKYDGGNISVFGSIDRVDEYNGYIRIVDYKTGTKTFKLPDVLFGLNLQMLIYLYAVTRCQKKNDSTAVGIFYMPSKRDLNNEGMAMNGLLKADLNLVTAMDKQNNGEFIPHLPLNKDGSVSKTATSFISEEEFSNIFDYIEKLMCSAGNSISSGDISVSPIDGRESAACDYCDYKSVCGFENGTPSKVPNMKNIEVFEKMKEGEYGI